jgi:acetyl esterase/lipase
MDVTPATPDLPRDPNAMLLSETAIIYASTEGHDLELDIDYYDDVPRPTLLYIHGGGWMDGNKELDYLKEFAAHYNAAGFNTIRIDYRKAWDATLPGMIDDCRAALHWAFENAEQYNIDTGEVVVSGESAGGHLALMTGLISDDAPFAVSPGYPERSPAMRVAAIVNFFGITDVNSYLEHNVEAYPPGHEWHSPLDEQQARFLGPGQIEEQLALGDLVSPVSHLTAQSPPVYTLHGDSDPTVPYWMATRLNETAESVGAEHNLVTMVGGAHSVDDTNARLPHVIACLATHDIE